MNNCYQIHLESVNEGRNKYRLVFSCYMPNSNTVSEFEYTGTDITGCVSQDHFLYGALKTKLNKDFGYPPFEIEKARAKFPKEGGIGYFFTI